MYDWYKESYEDEEQFLREIERCEFYNDPFSDILENLEDYDTCHSWDELQQQVKGN